MILKAQMQTMGTRQPTLVRRFSPVSPKPDSPKPVSPKPDSPKHQP